MDGKQIFTDPAPDSESDKTAFCVTTAVAHPPARGRKIRRCIDWLFGWSFILSWLIVATFGESRDLSDESEENERNSRGTY